MPRLRARAGVSLAEMIVSLTLSAMVAAAAAAALASTERYVRGSRTQSESRRTLREGGGVLVSELEGVPADSVRVRGDTALDFDGLVGVSVLCVASGRVLVLPPDAAASGPPYSTWRAAPESGDVLAVFDTAGNGTWRTALVDSSSTRTDGAGCRPSSGFRSAADSAARRPVMRVVLQSPLDTAAAIVGAPVRISRAGRYALTRAADLSWSLSYRRCTGSSCGAAQPVAGPFAAPSDSGLVFANVGGSADLVVSMRAPAAPDRPGRESRRLRVTLRNHGAAAP